MYVPPPTPQLYIYICLALPPAADVPFSGAHVDLLLAVLAEVQLEAGMGIQMAMCMALTTQ